MTSDGSVFINYDQIAAYVIIVYNVVNIILFTILFITHDFSIKVFSYNHI